MKYEKMRFNRTTATNNQQSVLGSIKRIMTRLDSRNYWTMPLVSAYSRIEDGDIPDATKYLNDAMKEGKYQEAEIKESLKTVQGAIRELTSIIASVKKL